MTLLITKRFLLLYCITFLVLCVFYYFFIDHNLLHIHSSEGIGLSIFVLMVFVVATLLLEYRMTGRAFVCFYGKDKGEIATPLKRSLEQYLVPGSIYVDVFEKGGTPYIDILKRINRCKVLLVLIGDRWVETLVQKQNTETWNWVPEEIRHAHNQRKRILPLLFNMSTIPPRSCFPEGTKDLHSILAEPSIQNMDTSAPQVIPNNPARIPIRMGLDWNPQFAQILENLRAETKSVTWIVTLYIFLVVTFLFWLTWRCIPLGENNELEIRSFVDNISSYHGEDDDKYSDQKARWKSSNVKIYGRISVTEKNVIGKAISVFIKSKTNNKIVLVKIYFTEVPPASIGRELKEIDIEAYFDDARPPGSADLEKGVILK